MVKETLLPLALTAALALATLAQTPVPRPDPHRVAVPASAQATPSVAGDPGCEMVVDYYRDLNRAIFRADDFFEFLGDDQLDIEDLTPREAERIIASGESLVQDLGALDVPGAYSEGNDGIIALMQVNIDLINFYALDSSTVPNVNAFDQALRQIYEGEVALATACPAETNEIGGYVFYDPDELEQDLDLGN